MQYVWRLWVSINGFRPDAHSFVSGETLQEATAAAIRLVDDQYGGIDHGAEIVGIRRLTALLPYSEQPSV